MTDITGYPEYEVIEKKEIMSEAYSDLLGKFETIIDNEKLSLDDDSLIVKMYIQIADIYNHIFGSRYNTLEEMKKIENIYQFCRQFTSEIR